MRRPTAAVSLNGEKPSPQSSHLWRNFPALRDQGFKIIGATFVTGKGQLEGIRAPEFRATGLDSHWPVWDTMQSWRQIVSAAAKKNEMRLMDIASRVAAVLQFKMHLYDLAIALQWPAACSLKRCRTQTKSDHYTFWTPQVTKEGRLARRWCARVYADLRQRQLRMAGGVRSLQRLLHTFRSIAGSGGSCVGCPRFTDLEQRQSISRFIMLYGKMPRNYRADERRGRCLTQCAKWHCTLHANATG